MATLEVTNLLKNKYSSTARKLFQEPFENMEKLTEQYSSMILDEDIGVREDYIKKEFAILVEAITRKKKEYSTPGFYNGETISFEEEIAPAKQVVSEPKQEPVKPEPVPAEVPTFDEFNLDSPKEEESVKTKPSIVDEFESSVSLILDEFTL